jgi:hypothetical protein
MILMKNLKGLFKETMRNVYLSANKIKSPRSKEKGQKSANRHIPTSGIYKIIIIISRPT